MENKHLASDLAQMQSLPLEAKERMSTKRIEVWFGSWKKYTICNSKNKTIRFVTHNEEPNENGCYKKVKKKINNKKIEVDKLVSGTKLKPTEYIDAVKDGQVYVSFSGSKDSTVLADLCARFCKQYGYTLYMLFVNTGLEYPEIHKFVETFAEWLRNTYEIEVCLTKSRPEMRFDEVVKKYGYPVISKEVSDSISGAKNNIKNGVYSHRLCKLGVQRHEYGGLNDKGIYDYDKNLKKSMYRQDKWRFLLEADFDVSNYCCEVMKKKPSKKYETETGLKPIIATLACESRLRNTSWIQYGCNAFNSERPSSRPLSFWTEQDILHYIKKYNVPYCSVYGDIVIDEKVDGDNVIEGQINMIDYLGCYEQDDLLKTTGCNRTGCIFCMFGCHLEKEPNRFQRLKETHPRQYDYCINGGEMVDGKWQPSKEGLGLGKVLDYIGVDYE